MEVTSGRCVDEKFKIYPFPTVFIFVFSVESCVKPQTFNTEKMPAEFSRLIIDDDKLLPENQWQLINKIPGSKYLANRLLVVAALSESACELQNLPENNDIRALYNALVQLGYSLQWPTHGRVISSGLSQRKVPQQTVEIDCGASGTMARFISAVAAMDDFPITIKGSERLQQRPMKALFDALVTLGAKVECKKNAGCLPVTITGSISTTKDSCNNNLKPTLSVSLPGDISSQYISALLLIGSQLNRELEIHLIPPIVSAVYIKMTAQILQKAGVNLTVADDIQKLVIYPSSINLHSMTLNADPCSASYPLAAAAINGKALMIKPFNYLPEQQGEFRIVDLLREMGCDINIENETLYLSARTKSLQAIQKNMSEMPDIVQTLAVVACFAEGVSRFEDIAHLKLKESDRIADTARELRKLGIKVNFGEDWLEVAGISSNEQLQQGIIDSHDDHRMAMALSQLAWKKPGIVMQQPQVVAKSFPGFWQLMQSMGLHAQVE